MKNVAIMAGLIRFNYD